MYASKHRGFYITLPSNASQDIFKANTISDFGMDLAWTIDLEGEWEVALTEISYPHSWLNLPRDDAYFLWRTKPKETSHRESSGN